MRNIILALFLFTSNALFCQGSAVELSWINGEVKYENHVYSKKSKKDNFEKMLKWIDNDSSLKVVSIDKENYSIYAIGRTTIPVVNSRDDFTYVFYCEAVEDGIKFHFNKFYNRDVALSMEKIVTQNKDNERKLVQENLRYLKAGIHSLVTSKTSSFKGFIKEN